MLPWREELKSFLILCVGIVVIIGGVTLIGVILQYAIKVLGLE